MAKVPPVQPRDWIEVRTASPIPLQAVVCSVYPDKPGTVEAVYIDQRKRAINEDFVWKEDHWDFARSGVSGGYADNYDRLREYVTILRTGRLKP